MVEPERYDLSYTLIRNIQDVFDESPEDFHGQTETPAANHLFDVDKESENMNKEDGSLFNHLLDKLMYLSKRERPDIQTYVSFLCTLVQYPDKDDWNKLQKTIRYIEVTRWLPLTLEADVTMIIKWWIESLYGVHMDCQVHTGGAISIRKGNP